jgi:hypothetical protein
VEKKSFRVILDVRMEKLAENDLAYFYHSHVVIVVTAVTTISLTPVIGSY